MFAILFVNCERVQVFRLFSFAVHALFLPIINDSNVQSILLFVAEAHTEAGVRRTQCARSTDYIE